MPRIVDHQERRATIAGAACTIIAESGLEGTTLAKVARQAGVTTGAIQHYFVDKDRLLAAALERAYQEQLKRMARRAARTPYSLLNVLGEALPLTSRSRRTMRVWLAFWSQAVGGDPWIVAEQRRIHRDWSLQIRQELERAIAAGLLGRSLNLDTETEDLIAQIRVRALLDSVAFPPRRQRDSLGRYLARLPLPERSRPREPHHPRAAIPK